MDIKAGEAWKSNSGNLVMVKYVNWFCGTVKLEKNDGHTIVMKISDFRKDYQFSHYIPAHVEMG